MPDQSNETISETLELARLGKVAEEFQKGEVGKYLAFRARQAFEQATESLVDVDAADTKAIVSLQIQARHGRDFMRWIAELIEDGNVSLRNLELEELTHHES